MPMRPDLNDPDPLVVKQEIKELVRLSRPKPLSDVYAEDPDFLQELSLAGIDIDSPSFVSRELLGEIIMSEDPHLIYKAAEVGLLSLAPGLDSNK